MAIDPRIALEARAPDISGVVSTFQNALLNAQKGRQNEQVLQQADVMNPLLAQQAQQGVDINSQNIAAGEAQAQQAVELRKLKSINDFGVRNQSLVDNAIATGDAAPLQGALTQRLTTLKQQGLPTQETEDALFALGQGNIKSVVDDIKGAQNLYSQQIGQFQKTRVTSSKILEDGTTVQSLSTGGTNVIAPSGAVLTGDNRINALNKALGVEVTQTGAKEQAKSDVNIAEVTTLEDISKEKKLDIQKKKVTLDETKAKNQEARDTAINTKNARRKEADAAIVQIDSLLDDDRFSNAFGKVVTTTPELLRRQESIDAIADVNQIKGLITLESRQKLKGQGTITDSEQKILAQSATILDNPMISDERARKELRKIKRVFEDSSDRNRLKRETKERIEIEANEQSNLNNLSLDELMAERNRLGGQ